MAAIRIQPVRNRREKRQFLAFPWQLYRHDPYWVPPLRGYAKRIVGYTPHPFYEHAHSQTFVALRHGKLYGRIAAIDNLAHNRAHPDERRGFIGFFESYDDQEVATALFDAAREWLAERGLRVLRGPANPSLNYECGLLIQNFDRHPTFMMTYNPPYYRRLWEDYGFVKTQDLLTFVGHKRELESLESKVLFIVEEARRRFDIHLRHLDPSRFRQDVQMFLQIYNASLDGMWGHVPLSDAEIDHIAKELRYLIVPQLTLVAEIEGRPVGAVFGIPDYNPRIKRIKGRLFPWGFIHLLRRRRRIKRVRLVSTNVLPGYQRWGVGVVLVAQMVPPALAWGIEEGEFSWVLEDNHLSRRSLERGHVPLEKTHRIYDYFGDGG